MKPKQIHIVYGTSGEYEERTEWSVCAYENKGMAEAHAALANEVQARLQERLSSKWEKYRDDESVRPPPTIGNNPYDRVGSKDNRNGASYLFGPCELRTELPPKKVKK